MLKGKTMLTEEQKKERILGIGGSDIAAVAGISSYKTPLDVYLIKIGEKDDGDITSESIDVGNDLESYVANKYAQKMGVDIEIPQNSLVHPEYYWMRCNLDFIVKGSTIVGECKTTGALGEEWGDEGTDEIPAPYLLQCAHNAIVSEHLYGTTRVDLPVFSGGRGGLKHRVYTYTRNSKLESRIIEMEREFWQEHVEKRIPPQPTTFKEAGILWPSAQHHTKVATMDAIETINALKDIRDSIKKLQQQEEAKKIEICNYLQDASILLDADGSSLVTWKNQEANRMDLESFKKTHPKLYREFLKKSETRVLRIA